MDDSDDPKDAPPPPEPAEDSDDDPIPERPEGTETDEELDRQEHEEMAAAVDPPPPERHYRNRRLSDPNIIPRLQRRFARGLKNQANAEDLLAELIQSTFERACGAPWFPRPNETMFTWIYRPASASRKKLIRAVVRRDRYEVPLGMVDAERYVSPPDGEFVSDLDAARAEAVAAEEKRDLVAAAVLDAMRRDIALGKAANPDAAERQRRSRVLRRIRALAAPVVVAMTAVVLLGGGALYVASRSYDPKIPFGPDVPPPEDVAVKNEREGLDLCKQGRWDECADKLELAKAYEPALDSDPKVKAALLRAYEGMRDQAPHVDASDEMKAPPKGLKAPK